MAKCLPGCTCNRHKAYYRGGSKKGRKFSEQARQNISESAQNRDYTDGDRQRLAEQIRVQREDPGFEVRRIEALKESLTGSVCPEGCVCDKHSAETRQRISEARSGTTQSEETRKRIGEASREMWASKTPEEMDEIRARKSNAARVSWAREKAEGRVRQVGGYLNSNQELSLIPYMEALGYFHNTELWFGRKVPDFIDFKGGRGESPRGRIVEYFGNHWHPEPLEEQWVIGYYRNRGYSCTVIWEADLFIWLKAHEHLVTTKQHEHAWKVAHVNNGFKKPTEV